MCALTPPGLFCGATVETGCIDAFQIFPIGSFASIVIDKIMVLRDS